MCVPADAEPLSTQPITLVNEMVTDYAFTFFDVTVESGELAVTSDTVCNEDVDGDGQVGFLDLIAVLTDWGSCPGCSRHRRQRQRGQRRFDSRVGVLGRLLTAANCGVRCACCPDSSTG